MVAKDIIYKYIDMMFSLVVYVHGGASNINFVTSSRETTHSSGTSFEEAPTFQYQMFYPATVS